MLNIPDPKVGEVWRKLCPWTEDDQINEEGHYGDYRVLEDVKDITIRDLMGEDGIGVIIRYHLWNSLYWNPTSFIKIR